MCLSLETLSSFILNFAPAVTQGHWVETDTRCQDGAKLLFAISVVINATVKACQNW